MRWPFQRTSHSSQWYGPVYSDHCLKGFNHVPGINKMEVASFFVQTVKSAGCSVSWQSYHIQILSTHFYKQLPLLCHGLQSRWPQREECKGARAQSCATGQHRLRECSWAMIVFSSHFATLAHSFILSLNSDFLSTYYILGSNPDTGDTMIDKTDKIPAL